MMRETYRTARTAKRCDHYPRCARGIKPGERYLRAVVSPDDPEVGRGSWQTANICQEHMRPEKMCDLHGNLVVTQP